MVDNARLVPVESLKLYGRNPRRGDVEAIRESLRANGQYRPVVVRRKTIRVFRERTTCARAQARVAYAAVIRRAANEGDWKAAAWWLERSEPRSGH